jgi:cytochrome P450
VHSQVDRVATEDLSLGGQTVRAGDFLVMNLPAGNWDTDYVDDPDVFDVERKAQGHPGLATGYISASGKTSPGSRCRSHSPLWRAGCPR